MAQPWITQQSLFSIGDVLTAPDAQISAGNRVWLHALRGQGGANAASVDQNGLVLGATLPVSNDWSAGVAFAHALTETQTQYQTVRGRSLGFYGLSTFARDAWRIDAAVGGGRLSQDSTRYLDPTGLVARADTHGWYGSAAITARYHQQLGSSAFIEPYAGAAYIYSHTQAFKESGAGI
ncbi:MAG: hypothetical protein B7Y53_03965, partial [Halothiobacillus sp. 28-55-5]